MTVSIGPVTVRTGSLVRGAGVALACLMPSVVRRAEVVAASYAVAWPIDKPGIQLVVVVPDEDEEPWKQKVLPLATSGASWTGLMLLGSLAVRRSSVPSPVGALLLGAGVAVVDSAATTFFERIKDRALAAAQKVDSQMPDDSPADDIAGA
jgi:hypothetical protein